MIRGCPDAVVLTSAIVIVIAGFATASLEKLPQAFGEQLKILETKLNKHSITGVLENHFNYTIGGIVVQAEFYDKEGNLSGVRNFGYITKDELKAGEKSPYKIPDIDKPFPKTDFVVTAEGIDYTNMVEVSGEEMVEQVESLGRALENLPDEIVITVTTNETGHTQVVNKSVIHYDD